MREGEQASSWSVFKLGPSCCNINRLYYIYIYIYIVNVNINSIYKHSGIVLTNSMKTKKIR